MDKQQLLRDYKKQEDKMCLAQIIDKIEMSRTRGKIECTDFLDMYQVSLAESFLKKNQIQNYKLYGGYPDSERKILIAYPENYTEEMIAKNYSKFLKVVKIELTEEDKGWNSKTWVKKRKSWRHISGRRWCRYYSSI